jgi:hypothetical protein
MHGAKLQRLWPSSAEGGSRFAAAGIREAFLVLKAQFIIVMCVRNFFSNLFMPLESYANSKNAAVNKLLVVRIISANFQEEYLFV